MINILSFDLCEHSGVLYVIMILKLFIKVCKIIAPIILILTIIFALTKAVGNPDELKKVFPSAVKKFIAALLIFFVPTIVNYAMDSLANRDPNSFATCSTNANMEYIKSLKEKEEYERKVRLELREKEAAEAAEKANQKLEEDNASTNGNQVYKDKKKQREQQQQQYGGGSGSPESRNTTVPSGTLNIIIGDSRTVGMCGSMTGNYSGCPFEGNPKVDGNDLYIAKSAMGYAWFESTAIPAVNKIIADHPGTRYNIISLMGVNYLLSDIDKYIVKYNELANGSWKDQNIILVSVNPVNEQIEASHGYSTKNANIETFNQKLKNGTAGHGNIGYCDVYNQIKGNFGTSDGLHYNNETNKQIHNLMLNCV